MKGNRALLWAGLFAFFLLTALLALFFRDAVRELVVIPLLYLAWLAGLVFRSVHQGIIWGLLVAIVTILLFARLRSLSSRTGEQRGELQRPGMRGRVNFWARQLEIRANDTFPDEIALQEFKKLIVSVLSYRLNLSPQEVEDRLRRGEVAAPPEIRAYFQPPQSTFRPVRRVGFLGRLLHRLRGTLGARADAYPWQVEEEMERIIQYTQSMLEGTNRDGVR